MNRQTGSCKKNNVLAAYLRLCKINRIFAKILENLTVDFSGCGGATRGP
nr:MAG TPA: hypothetical protein [Caudoviricetes sp.]